MNSNLFVGQHVIKLDEIDSTNNYARALLRDKMPTEGTVVVAKSQTDGRGQRSNIWVSQSGLNLTCSYILRPVFLSAANQFSLSATVALSVLETVLFFTDNPKVKIKWPNDILVDGKKIAGILIENTLRRSNLDASIIGVGLNVNQKEFSGSLNATSLKNECSKNVDLSDVLDTINRNLEKNYLRLKNGRAPEILDQFNQNMFGANQKMELAINNELHSVIILGTTKTGELKVQHSDGRESQHQHHEIGWGV